MKVWVQTMLQEGDEEGWCSAQLMVISRVTSGTTNTPRCAPAERRGCSRSSVPVMFLSSFLCVRTRVNTWESQFTCSDSVFTNFYL